MSVALAVRFDKHNEKYRCAGEWRENGLRNGRYVASAGYAHVNTIDCYGKNGADNEWLILALS
jgi:hypothetical protein